MTAVLVSPVEAASRIVDAFKSESPCCVQVQEQRAFKDDRWLGLGAVSLPPNAPGGDSERRDAALASAGFEWQLPEVGAVESELASLLEVKRDDDRIPRALDQTAAIAVRAGLLHPVFDPSAVEEMPFRRATTVVSDTSGVLQGALDFVVRHLHPAARVKIPAIVQMEFVNSAHRFFSIRRSNEAKDRRNRGGNNRGKLLRAGELIEHLKSQGGQRTLLRIELQADAEIERTWLLGDPLRDAFRPDSDGALRDLNINVSVPAYADRLILEAARRHRAQSEPGHAMRLLTSDQGLARMVLAEGMTPLYFTAVKCADFFGTRLTGRTFNPFTGGICSIPLTRVLWELATAFGAARLQWEDGGAITISALSDDASWSPFQSVDDLLWFTAREADGIAPASRPDSPAARTNTAGREKTAVVKYTIPSGSFQRMNVNSLLRLICALDDNQKLEGARVAALLDVRSSRSVDEYRRFLLSAGLLEIDDHGWMAAGSVQALSAALRNENTAALRDALLEAPSFAAFDEHLAKSTVGHPVDMSHLSRSAATYRTLGELTLTCASAGGSVFVTPARPAPDRFSQIALRRFRELDGGDGLVATGRWLEWLIQHDGIHPETARRALEQASEEGLLRRSTEGSTMQTDFDSHVVHVLRVEAGTPVAMPVHLYRGDYLVPGKASVSLRIEGRP